MATYKNRYGGGVPGAAAPSTISQRRNDGQSSRRPITQTSVSPIDMGRMDGGNTYQGSYGDPLGGMYDKPGGAYQFDPAVNSSPAVPSVDGAGQGAGQSGGDPWAGGIPDGYNSDEMAAMISQIFGDQLGGGVRDTTADEELIRQMMAGEVGGNLADLNARLGGMGFADSGASAAMSGDIYQQGARTAAEDIMGLRQRARDDYQDQIAQAAQILFGERELGMSEDYYATIQQYIDSLMGGGGGDGGQNAPVTDGHGDLANQAAGEAGNPDLYQQANQFGVETAWDTLIPLLESLGLNVADRGYEWGGERSGNFKGIDPGTGMEMWEQPDGTIRYVQPPEQGQ